MKILKLAIAALFVLALIVPASVSAQMRMNGYVVAGLGMYTDDDGIDSVTDWIGESQAQIDFRGSNGDVAYRYRLRVREKDNTLAAVRHRVTWNVSDALSIDFEGRSFGVGATFTAYGNYTVGHFGDGFTIGDALPNKVAFFVNDTGINTSFSTGSMKFGLFIIADCAPACPNSGGLASAVQEDMTTVLHFSGKFGAIGIGFYAASASATDVDTGDGSDASETNLMVSFKTGSIGIGFEYTIYGDVTENEGNGMAIGVNMGMIQAHMVTYAQTNAADADTIDSSEIALAYVMPIADKSSLAIGYVAATDNLAAAGAGATDTLLIVSAKSGF